MYRTTGHQMTTCIIILYIHHTDVYLAGVLSGWYILLEIARARVSVS